jgi:hypothetical protein
MSISTILLRLAVKPITAHSRPAGATTMPAAPFTAAGCAIRAIRESPPVLSICAATAEPAPLTD